MARLDDMVFGPVLEILVAVGNIGLVLVFVLFVGDTNRGLLLFDADDDAWLSCCWFVLLLPAEELMPVLLL